ncbi:MAG: CopD family protein [Bacteroidota bacterium]
MPSFLLFKALHVFGFVAWFAGLFYLVRIFVYHTEAMERPEPARSILVKEFNAMQWRVYKIICNPGMMITWFCGLAMLHIYGLEWLKSNPWMHVKLVLLVALLAYHLHAKKVIQKLERGETYFSSYQFRLWNELPTLFLLSIALLAVYKNTINFLYAFLGIIGFAFALVMAAKMYKNYREKQLEV